MDDPPAEQRPPPGPATTRVVLSADHLDHDLAGSLPCLVCGYELKGLSIRGVCPECGTAIRATILYKVDPRAEEFRQVYAPWVLAWSLVLWSAGALVSALACWVLRGADFFDELTGRRSDIRIVAMIAVGAAALSGLGSIAMIRPVHGTPRKHVLSAALSSAAYVPLVWVMCLMLIQTDPRRSPPYFSGDVKVDRVVMRLAASAAVVVIILGLRPNARDLVKRCMVLRTGRVDRQTLLLMAATIGLTMAGDGLRLAGAGGPAGELGYVSLAGTMLVALGSGLFTLGLGAALADSWRISRAILIPSPSMRQLIGGPSAS